MRPILSLFIWSCMAVVLGQSAGTAVVAGDNVNKQGKIVNWSIGHLITHSAKTSTAYVYSGALPVQYYFFYDETPGELEVDCYPNPAQEHFFIEIKTNDYEHLRWEMYSSKGEKVLMGKSMSNVFKVNIAQLQAASYYLNVFNQNDERMSTVKLLKK